MHFVDKKLAALASSLEMTYMYKHETDMILAIKTYRRTDTYYQIIFKSFLLLFICFKHLFL